MKPILLALLGTSILAAACDPAPRVWLRNSTSGPLTLTFEGGASEVLEPRKRTAVSQSMIVEGDCVYAFEFPGDFWRMGSVRMMEVREDMKIYLYRSGVILNAKDVQDQGSGWPISATSKTCR